MCDVVLLYPVNHRAPATWCPRTQASAAAEDLELVPLPGRGTPGTAKSFEMTTNSEIQAVTKPRPRWAGLNPNWKRTGVSIGY